jgi:hypothetical protein
MKSKTKRILTTVFAAFLMAAVIYGCRKDDYLEIEGVCPLVVSTYPVNGATSVPNDAVITVTFNEDMNAATFTEYSITLQGGSKISGTMTYDNSNYTLSFQPDDLLPANTTFTGTVTTSVKDLMGNALQENYVWSFSTGSGIMPMVIATDPANNATNVPLNKKITATFNMPMDPSTFDASTFNIKLGAFDINGTVTYSGTTATFTPQSNLNPGSTYVATISGVKSANGTPLAADYQWSFSTGTLVAPTVILTDPVNNATGVPVNKVVTATFSTAMDPLTINNSTFIMRQGNNAVAGTVTYSGTQAIFTPAANFLAGALYTATIKTGAKNLAGTALANDYVWSFTTVGAVAPTVISTDPANNAINVATNKVIRATFSVPMDPATINNSSFTVMQGTTPVAGTVTYSGNTASFTPASSLVTGNQYTATISNTVKNASGVNMVNNYVWRFSTGTMAAPFVISTDPSNNAMGVALNKTVTATFNMAMDPTTLNSSTFTIRQGSNPVTGVITYNGNTATFTHVANFNPGTLYTATITTGAKNTFGAPMAANYVWVFTTQGTTAPTVISTDPANNATGVLLNKTVTATFSMAMDPLTINGTTFTLKQGAASIAGVVTYSGTTASFNPDADLLSGKVYTATITTGAKNSGGTPMAANYVWTFTTKNPAGAPFVDLKSVGRFGIIAGVGVSNNAGFSKINNMDVGISPGVRSSVTGFPPAIVVNGAIYASDDIAPPGVAAMLTQAKQDLTDAYLFAEGASTPAPVTVSGDQGGLTLAPGIYKSTSTLLVQNGDLTLDAQGDVNAVWIFQIASGFTTVGGAGGSIILTGGAQAKNIFWQTGTSAVIGDNTAFKGTILALTSITMNSGATAVGRMLARNAAVVLTNTNIIDKP